MSHSGKNLTLQTISTDGITLDKLKTVLLPEKPFVIMIDSFELNASIISE